jgi:hypothetical protein
MALTGKGDDGGLRTFRAKVYPPSMCKAIARSFMEAFLAAHGDSAHSGELPSELCKYLVAEVDEQAGPGLDFVLVNFSFNAWSHLDPLSRFLEQGTPPSHM